MSGDRPVVVCLATARSAWLARLSHWVNSGSLAVELVRCLTPAEFDAALRAGPVALGLVEAGSRHTDRDLLGSIRWAGGAPVVVSSASAPERDWTRLGAEVVLDADFEPAALADLLRVRERASAATEGPGPRDPDVRPVPGHLVGVCGPGGTGASTVAIATAQGLAARAGRVLLADLVPGGQQALLHGDGATPGGIAALTESHRRQGPATHVLEGLAHPVPRRGYSLLTGLFHRRAWPTLRPMALAAALSTITSLFDTVVCDFEPDLEGEAEAGSMDVEERNAAARLVAARATAVVVVGQPGIKGLHSLATVMEDLTGFGVPAERIIPVFNRAPRSPLGRRELAAALRRVTAGMAGREPVFLPERPIDRLVTDNLALPPWLVAPCADAVAGVLAATPAPSIEPETPVAVVPA